MVSPSESPRLESPITSQSGLIFERMMNERMSFCASCRMGKVRFFEVADDLIGRKPKGDDHSTGGPGKRSQPIPPAQGYVNLRLKSLGLKAFMKRHQDKECRNPNQYDQSESD